MKSVLRALVPIALMASLAAIAQAARLPQPCAVNAHAVIHTYDGPIEIDQLCMTLTHYTGGQLQFEAVDMGDGIFRDGFDGE